MMALIEQDAALKALDDLQRKQPGYESDGWESGVASAYDCIAEQPIVDAVPVVRCKNCKYFELNSWANVGGHPLIVAHEICKRWGDGCKTSPEGYCFMGERKDGKDDDNGIHD